MANFQSALEKLLKHEGGYVNDPDDSGGETYKGISREYYPYWRGWHIIDRLNEMYSESFENALASSHNLQKEVKLFYEEHYWHRFWGDKIPSQDVANLILNMSVHMGIRQSIEYLQRSLNILNRNGIAWADIVEDGIFGSETLKALKACCKDDVETYQTVFGGTVANCRSEKYLIKLMKIFQGYHYIQSCERRPVNEKYIRGWLNRIGGNNA